MILIRTRALPDGRVLETWLRQAGDAFAVIEPAGADPAAPPCEWPVSARAVEAVFGRYGRPLDVALPPIEEDDASVSLRLSGGADARVRAFRYRAPVDVIANDWLVLEPDGGESVAGPSRLLGAAIVALARATAEHAHLDGE